MNWIPHSVALEGARVQLMPLQSIYFDGLIAAATDHRIWEHMTSKGSDSEILRQDLNTALLKRATGEMYAFTIFDKRTNTIIGSTMLHNIHSQHRKLEIGWSWLHPDHWGTGINTECKLALLTYCFETLHCARVQFQIREENARSRRAIEKLGATYEGLCAKTAYWWAVCRAILLCIVL